MLVRMDDIPRAIVLGIIQGATEFLPISSSGHLIIARELFGWDFTDELTFDVAAHVGTLIAVVAYFWGEWVSMLRGAFSHLFLGERGHPIGDVYDGRLLAVVLLGCVPAAIVGVVLESWAEEEIRSAAVVGVTLIAGGAVLLLAERLGKRSRAIENAGWRDSAVIGGAQALALIPGVSRSGATISAGLFENFTRQDAARFSFLLATPTIAGAALLTAGKVAVEGVPAGDGPAIIVGTITSAIVGWLCIRFLMRFLQTSTYLPFVIYRFVAGAFVLLVLVP